MLPGFSHYKSRLVGVKRQSSLFLCMPQRTILKGSLLMRKAGRQEKERPAFVPAFLLSSFLGFLPGNEGRSELGFDRPDKEFQCRHGAHANIVTGQAA